MEKLKRKEPEMKEIPRRIDYLRSKQSNHLTAMVGIGVSFIFGLFSIKELLLFIPFSIMIFSIFLHFFSRYRYYLLAESVLLFQAGLAGHEPVRKLFVEKSYPRRSYWWEDGEWFNQLMEKTNKKHTKRSFIYWIWLLTPRWRKETFCHCVIWGSVVFLRLFKDSLKTLLNILNLYDCMSSIIISILKIFKTNQEYYFYCFSWLLVLIAFFLSGVIIAIRENRWRSSISKFKKDNKVEKSYLMEKS